MRRVLFFYLSSVVLSARASSIDLSGVGEALVNVVGGVVLLGGSVLSISLLIQSLRWVRGALGHSPAVAESDADFWKKYDSGDAVEGVDFVDAKDDPYDGFPAPAATSGGFASDAQRKYFYANAEADSGGSSFDAGDKSTFEAEHWAAHQAGMSGERDRDGEASWTTDQWLAFDAGRDDAHEKQFPGASAAREQEKALRAQV